MLLLYFLGTRCALYSIQVAFFPPEHTAGRRVAVVVPRFDDNGRAHDRDQRLAEQSACHSMYKAGVNKYNHLMWPFCSISRVKREEQEEEIGLSRER